jgi:aldehyde:ferredoxin oxidoreductase
VFADGDASCGGGMGAVMGSKNLKAVAAAPLGGSWVAAGDRDRLKRIEKEIRGYGRGNVKVWGLDFMASGENTRKFPCYGCMANCLRVKYTAENGKSGKFMCQSRFFYMAHSWGYYGEENDVPFYANRLCDELGIDTWEVQGVIEWLLRCHAEGMITDNESGLDLTKVGSFEFIRDLVEGMAYRRGFGELLCKGAEKASREYGRGAEKLYNRNDPYDPRYCTVNIMLLPFETREPIQQLHEAGLVLSQWSSWAKGVEEAHISSDVVRGIAQKFWGSEQAGDMTTLSGKALAAVKIQDRQLAKESAEICDWMFPLIDNPSGLNGEARVGDPSLEARLLSAALGRELTEEQYYRYGERVFALQRAIMLREGHRSLKDDVLAREYHEDPLEYHVADPDCLVPGCNGNITSQVGNVIDPKSYSRLREEYYELRGWDVPTGLPSVKGLNTLGLADVAEELQARGLAVKRARKVPAPVILGRKAVSMVGGLIASVGRAVKSVIGADGQSRSGPAGAGTAAGPAGPQGPTLRGDELRALMEEQQVKFTDPAVAHNFEGWNKTMLYYFPDIGEYYILPIKDGVGQTPEKVSDPPKKPDIYYEMSTETLRAMTRGEISGFKAYQQRKLKLKASFTDMMKLQSLNKV